jgi:hypothetical protein
MRQKVPDHSWIPALLLRDRVYAQVRQTYGLRWWHQLCTLSYLNAGIQCCPRQCSKHRGVALHYGMGRQVVRLPAVPHPKDRKG